jgi:hypothetical protein
MRMLVMVAGRVFRGVMDGRSLKLGFYANREVVAETLEALDEGALFAQVQGQGYPNGSTRRLRIPPRR